MCLIINLDALDRARKATDDLVMMGKRIGKIDEKMQDFANKDHVEKELKTFYAPLKSHLELENRMHDYTLLSQFIEY